MLPLTIAALAAPPIEASAEAPPWLPVGDLATGSSGPGSGANPAGPSEDSAPSLGPAGLPSGSAFGPGAEGASSGGPLDLGPVRTPSGSAGSGSARPGYLATGSAAPGSAGPALLGTGDVGLGGSTHVTADAAPHPNVVPGSPAEALRLDTGSVQMACSGSAMAGSALLLLGLVTGSGFGSSGSSLVGPGSNGSGLGSAALGSAATGSALLTCLLLLPAAPPPVPMSPLQLGPPARRFVPFPADVITQTPPLHAERPSPSCPRPRTTANGQGTYKPPNRPQTLSPGISQS